MDSKLISAAVDRAIVDVDLYSKENDLTKNLSGG
jgi:energy-coupling factor transporter ATP-binding protein EcfA2